MLRSILNQVESIEESSRARLVKWIPQGIAVILAGMGILNMLYPIRFLSSEFICPLENLSPFSIQPGEPLPIALLGFNLIILADGLWRRKRVAWLISLLVLIASSINYLTNDPDYGKATISIILGVGILLQTPRYNVSSDRRSTQKAVKILGIMFFLTMTYSLTGLYVLRMNNEIGFDLWDTLHDSIVMFTQFYNPAILHLSVYSRYFMYSISTISAISLGYSLFLSLQPVQIYHASSTAEQQRARAIVEAHGRSSMARLTLLKDNAYFFSTGGSVIAYTIQGRISLALGDPIGPNKDIPCAIVEFLALCRKNDWLSAFCLTTPDFLEFYRQSSLGALCLGHEGIVHLNNFTLVGRANKTFRKRFNRLTEMGFRVVFLEPPIPRDLILKLREVSDEWLSMNGTTEKRFLLGSFDEEYIRSEPIAVVYTPDDQISAFANIITEYQRNEVSVDLMRRRKDAEPGTMDFLFVSLFQWAKQRGYDTFNIGLSPLFGVGLQSNTTLPEKFIRLTYMYGNFFFDFKGLNAFKDKFHPKWEPQYLIYPGFANLPVVWLNLVRANAGEQGSVWKYFMPKTRKRRKILHN